MRGVKPEVTAEYSTANRIKLIHSGEEYFKTLIDLIKKAKVSVQLQVYIFNEDETGRRVANALIDASRRGVKAYVLVDAYASQEMSEPFLRELEEAGVHFQRFEPLFKSKRFYFGRRLHHKMVVADDYYALIGGINIADRYNDIDSILAWLDYAILIEGEAAMDVAKVGRDMWQGSGGANLQISTIDEKRYEDIPAGERYSIRVRRNDWVKTRSQVSRSYFELFNQANESIVIMCSYFLPGWKFRKRLVRAVKRGVSVKVIVAGPSDVPVAKYAERYLYKWMIKNRMEVYEYEKNVLHAKLAIRDGKWMTIGSYNVNNISAYASIELNVDIRNQPFVKNVEQEINNIIEHDCVRIDAKTYKLATNVFKYIAQKMAYEFFNLLLFLSTFYFRKE